MKCVILAGGFATRLWPLSENKAKPLLHLKDRPILSHIVDGLPRDIPIVLSTNAIFEGHFRDWAKDHPGRDINIFVEDSAGNDSKKGALGAAALAIQQLGIDEDLLLIAGDNYFGFRLEDFIRSFKGHPILAAYDLKQLNAAMKFGVVVANPDGTVAGFQEKPLEPKSTLVSTGCYVFPKRNLKDIVSFAQANKDNLGGIFEHLLLQGERIEAFTFVEPWYDIGSFEGYLRANRELLGGQTITQEGVRVDDRSQLKGGVYLGPNTLIEDSVVENTVILKDGVVKDCVLRDCVVDEGCTLTGLDLSHQMIRRGSVIERIHG